MTATTQQLRERIAKLVEASPVYDAFIHEGSLKQFVEHGTSFNIGVSQDNIWGHTASLGVDRDLDVSVSWSSTQRTPAMAQAVLGTYIQIVALAQLIQATIDCTRIKDTA